MIFVFWEDRPRHNPKAAPPHGNTSAPIFKFFPNAAVERINLWADVRKEERLLHRLSIPLHVRRGRKMSAVITRTAIIFQCRRTADNLRIECELIGSTDNRVCHLCGGQAIGDPKRLLVLRRETESIPSPIHDLHPVRSRHTKRKIVRPRVLQISTGKCNHTRCPNDEYTKHQAIFVSFHFACCQHFVPPCNALRLQRFPSLVIASH